MNMVIKEIVHKFIVMKISHEVPLSMLKESFKFNNYDYLLPHLLKHPEYKAHFVEAKSKNRFIIMDNGLFENVFHSEEELLDVIKEYKPNIFIIPDAWNSPSVSLNNAEKWVKRNDLPAETKLMGVIQCNTLDEAKDLYKSYENLGITHIAFNHSSAIYPRIFPHKSKLVSQAMGRIRLINELLDSGVINTNFYHHLLGCSLPQEFMYYEGYDFINSVDTSNPVISGILNIPYKQMGSLSKPKTKIDEFIDVDLSLHKPTIYYNINTFKQYCMNQINFMSLYDYLGRAAGPELGWSVAKFAHQNNQPVKTRLVENPVYTGKINLYDENFLKEYFNHPQHASIIAEDKVWYSKRNKK